MRNLFAGTYYLRLYNPLASQQTVPLAYTIQISPQARGQFHPTTDNDVVCYTSPTTFNINNAGTGLDAVFKDGLFQQYAFNG